MTFCREKELPPRPQAQRPEPETNYNVSQLLLLNNFEIVYKKRIFLSFEFFTYIYRFQLFNK